MGTLIFLLGLQASDSLRYMYLFRGHVEKLCRFQGRGYQKNGHQKAARYVYKVFKKHLTQVRYDTIYFSVNQIQRVKLSWKGKKWKLGEDYIVGADSPPILGRYQVDTVPQKGQWLWTRKVIPDSMLRRWGVVGQIITTSKLVASVSSQVAPFPSIFTTHAPQVGQLYIRLHSQRKIQQGYNVIGVRAGMRSDSIGILGAHYDHLGRQGKAIFYGANDNASGVSFLLTLAQSPAFCPVWDTWFVAFTAEEVGLVGSWAFVEKYRSLLPKIAYMLNFDLVGFGERGAVAVNALAPSGVPHAHFLGWKKRFEQAFMPFRLRANAPNSDHYPFSWYGVPAVFIYLEGGPGYYHDVHDKPKTLSGAGTYRLFKVIQAGLSTCHLPE
ncbi:MAG: M28 family metallopeptidase [Bacteroidia bacterium]